MVSRGVASGFACESVGREAGVALFAMDPGLRFSSRFRFLRGTGVGACTNSLLRIRVDERVARCGRVFGAPSFCSVASVGSDGWSQVTGSTVGW